ncbi:hypothetical protein AB0B28_15405 [Glycomyces sp. NPDC046736]|uniref:hypothetical protein n=1 Tax=Glycomyces sp. NPDC046736 TaxID=3155615 RepID=UPI0033DA83AD
MSRVSVWWGSELSQSHAINELDEELAAERSARRAQARRLQETRSEFDRSLKAVGSKFDSVAERIDEVFAWTELRFQLLEFDEYQARKEIRKTFRALVEERPAPSPEFDDVPGYWLPPAASAVLPLVLRDRVVPTQRSLPFADLKAGFEAAGERDGIRAELFNLAAGRCFEQPALIDAAVLRLLGEAVDLGVTEPGQVAAGWRTLWEQTAAGAFGPGAAEQLTQRLRQLFDADDESEIAAWDRALDEFVTTGGRAEGCAALVAHLTAEDIEPEAPQDDVDWQHYLQELIEEPSPAELPLVREMEALELGEAARHSRPTWTEPAGTVTALVRRDLLDPDGPVALRRLALDIAGPVLRARAEHLAHTLPAPVPTETKLRRRGVTVTVTASGADKKEVAAVEDRFNRSAEAGAPSTAPAVGIAIALGAFALLMLSVQQWFLGVVFVLAIVFPVLWQRRRQETHREDLARRDEQLVKFRSEIVNATKAAAAEDESAAKTYSADRSALDDLVAAIPLERPRVL